MIDIDADSIKEAPKHADKVQEELDNKRMYYSRWLSGGDGIHFHLLFKPKVMIQLIERYGRMKIKEVLLHYLISPENIKPKDIKSHICFGANRLICLEYSRHKKGKYKTLIKDVYNKRYNEFPEELIIKLETNKLIQEKGSIKYRDIKKRNPDYKLPCNTFITGEDTKILNVFELQDGLYRLMFIYVSLLVKKGLDANKIFESAVIWRNNFNSSWLQNSKFKVSDKNIKYMIKTCRGEVSCNFISSAFSEIGAQVICDNCIMRKG